MSKLNYTQEIVAHASEYKLEPSQAKDLVGNLPQIQSEREALEQQYDEIIKMDIEAPETAKKARELRILIKENRTKGITVWHKTTKEYFLKAAQFIDAVKRKEEAVNVRMEDNLEQIEKHLELKKKREREELHQSRLNELAPYSNFVPFGINYGDITEDEYKKVYNGAKLQHEQMVENQKIEEEERLIKEEQERKERLEREEAERKEREEARKKAEEERIKFIEREKKLQEERKKAEEERKKVEQQLKKEQEEKKKLEAQLREKQEQEERAKKEEELKQRKLKNASDKVILLDIAKRIKDFNSSFPEVKGIEAKEIVKQTEEYLQKVSNFIIQKAESLTK